MNWPTASVAPTPRPYSCSLGGYLVGLELRDLPPAFGISIVIWAFSRRSRPKRRLWRCCQPAIGQGQCQDRAGLPSLSRPHFTTLRSPPPGSAYAFITSKSMSLTARSRGILGESIAAAVSPQKAAGRTRCRKTDIQESASSGGNGPAFAGPVDRVTVRCLQHFSRRIC